MCSIGGGGGGGEVLPYISYIGRSAALKGRVFCQFGLELGKELRANV